MMDTKDIEWPPLRAGLRVLNLDSLAEGTLAGREEAGWRVLEDGNYVSVPADGHSWAVTDPLWLMEALPVPEGLGWIFRESTTGRGWRLHTSSREGSGCTPTQAAAFGLGYAAGIMPPSLAGLIEEREEESDG